MNKGESIAMKIAIVITHRAPRGTKACSENGRLEIGTQQRAARAAGQLSKFSKIPVGCILQAIAGEQAAQ